MLPVSSKVTRPGDPAPAKATHEDGLGDARPRFGGLFSALRRSRGESVEPTTTGVPASQPGSGGSGPGSPASERPPALRMAEQLREHCHETVILLHHRRTPRVKPHIDHLVIAPSGVWIVHSRSNQGRVATRKPMFGEPRLTIAGRERTDLLLNLERQVGYVEAVLAKRHGDVPVRSAICFVDTEAPLLRPLYLGSYLFFGAPAIAEHLNSEGPCDQPRIDLLATFLEEQFPPA